MLREPLDFWNYPDWSGDSFDNLRDRKSEPFWMRPAKGSIPCKPAEPTISVISQRYIPGRLIIRNRDGIVIHATAEPGGGFSINPEDEKLL